MNKSKGGDKNHKGQIQAKTDQKKKQTWLTKNGQKEEMN